MILQSHFARDNPGAAALGLPEHTVPDSQPAEQSQVSRRVHLLMPLAHSDSVEYIAAAAHGEYIEVRLREQGTHPERAFQVALAYPEEANSG